MNSGFHRKDGILTADGIALDDIARQFPTPLYVYSAAAITDAYGRFEAAMCRGGNSNAAIHYAVKANSNIAVLRLIARLGGGADIVSCGELQRAMAAGIPPGKIIFSGVGKTDAEIRDALRAGIGQINAESESEITGVLEIAGGIENPQTRLGIRVNPDMTPDTHAKIATGGGDTKFGIPTDEAAFLYRKIAEAKSMPLGGLAVHIGSQIMDTGAYRKAWQALREFADGLRDEGLPVPMLDLGGGFGIGSDDDTRLAELGGIVAEIFGDSNYELGFEPGRFITAGAGVLLTRVLHVKQTPARLFIITDAAMNDFIRPTLYGAEHAIEPVGDAVGETVTADIVGPVCETGDYLRLGHTIAMPGRGDVLAVMDAGAYGAAMRSNYNSRGFAGEVMVCEDGTVHEIGRPQSASDLIGAETIPAPLK